MSSERKRNMNRKPTASTMVMMIVSSTCRSRSGAVLLSMPMAYPLSPRKRKV